MMPRIFVTLTTGRSGTGKLCSVLARVEGMIAQHEGVPCYSTVLHDNLTDPAVGRDFVARKLDCIARLDCRYYCDTSFVIGEGFIEHFLALGIIPDAIILRRDPRLVASSMYALATVPGRLYQWNEVRIAQNPYFLRPGEGGSFGYPDWREADDYALCYWFCCEIERRARYYAALLRSRGATVVEIETPQLSDVSCVAHMLANLKLPGVAASAISPERVNHKDDLKERALPAGEVLEQIEAAVIDRIVRANRHVDCTFLLTRWGAVTQGQGSGIQPSPAQPLTSR